MLKKLPYYILNFVIVICASAHAEDQIGTYNTEGQYVAYLPWTESFDNFGGNYDGTAQLPNGWMASGDVPFTTAYSASNAAHTGTYYMVTNPSTTARNDRAYTPFFDLKAGHKYSFSFWLWMPGQKNYGSTNHLTVTVGTEQDFEFHSQVLLDINDQLPKWTEYTISYSPPEDGLKCFCFNLLTEAPLSGYVGIEDVALLDADQILPPSASFGVDGLVSMMYDDYAIFPTGSLHLTNLSKNATEYEWSIPGAEPGFSTEKDLDVKFAATGTYSISLTVRNGANEQTTERKVNVGYYDQDDDYMILQNFYGALDKTYARGQVPTFATDPNNDFYTGPNHYYHIMAERFPLPEIQEIEVSRISYFLTNFTMIASNSSTTWPVQANVPVTVRLIGEADGMPDDSKVFGEISGPMKQMIKDRGIGVGEMREFAFPTPVRVKGTFYVVVEFSEDFLVDSPDHNLNRSHFAMSPSLHHSGVSSMYVKPHHNVDGSTAEKKWFLASDFHPDLAGYGLAMNVWGKSMAPNLEGCTPQSSTSSTKTPIPYDLTGRPLQTPQGLYITNHKTHITR